MMRVFADLNIQTHANPLDPQNPWSILYVMSVKALSTCVRAAALKLALFLLLRNKSCRSHRQRRNGQSRIFLRHGSKTAAIHHK